MRSTIPPWSESVSCSQRLSPAAVAGPTGLAAPTVERLAWEIAGARSAAVYGRAWARPHRAVRWTAIPPFATLASWLIAVINVLTGNLDREGGGCSPPPAEGRPRSENPDAAVVCGFPVVNVHSVRGLPSVLGEFPAAVLAEEIDTPDSGNRRTHPRAHHRGRQSGGSIPDADRLEKALGTLDLLVCVDAYVTETSRHADVILPLTRHLGPQTLRRGVRIPCRCAMPPGIPARVRVGPRRARRRRGAADIGRYRGIHGEQRTGTHD